MYWGLPLRKIRLLCRETQDLTRAWVFGGPRVEIKKDGKFEDMAADWITCLCMLIYCPKYK